MPLSDFRCPEHGLFEKWFRSYPLPDTHECKVCGAVSERKRWNKLAIVGPIFHDLMAINDQLIGKSGGRELKDHRDVKKWESDQGLRRMTDRELKTSYEWCDDEGADISRVRRETNDQNAVADFIEEREMLDVTGESKNEYLKRKRWEDEARTAVADGRINPERAAAEPSIAGDGS